MEKRERAFRKYKKEKHIAIKKSILSALFTPILKFNIALTLKNLFFSAKKFLISLALVIFLAVIVTAGDVIIQSGKIGIGTTPVQELDIIGQLKISSTIGNKIVLSGAQPNDGGKVVPHTILLEDSKGIRFWDNINEELLRITDIGNVGIGIANPSYLLQVASVSNAVNLSGVLYVGGDSGNVGIGTDAPNTFDLQIAGNIGPDITDTYSIGSVPNMNIVDQSLSDADASFWGEGTVDESGYSVSGVGDVNGDGYDDFIIGAPINNEGAVGNRGQTYLILGKASGWEMDISLSDASASFWGENAGDLSGWAVSEAGDVNGDGYDDFIIGAWLNNENFISAGQTYLILGKASGWSMDISLSAVDASFWGESSSDLSGSALSGVGDVNGDGYDDFIIGAPFNDDGPGNIVGQTYLILGKASGWEMDIRLSDADASFWGEGGGDQSGSALSGVGDVNGDGYDDFIIGAPFNDDGGSSAGQTYLILGKASGWAMDIRLSDANASFHGSFFDKSGWAVSGAGDVNGDGYDDFLIGAIFNDDGGYRAGQTYLILGKASGWEMDTSLSAADASFSGESSSDLSGYSVSGAGDVNGDGYDDFLIGTFENDAGGSSAGQTYLILGKASGWEMDISLSDADASFWGEGIGDESGFSISEAGDVNGDGYDDFLIGAPSDQGGSTKAGQTYLILANETQFDSILARHVNAGKSISVGNILSTDNNKVSVHGGMDITGNVGIGTTKPYGRLDLAGGVIQEVEAIDFIDREVANHDSECIDGGTSDTPDSNGKMWFDKDADSRPGLYICAQGRSWVVYFEKCDDSGGTAVCG